MVVGETPQFLYISINETKGLKMSQLSLSSHLFEIELINEEVSKQDLIDLFFDNDFTENEDYFQEDTLELGYESEAERLATEFFNNEDMNAYDKIEACINAQLESSNYYHDYDIESTRIGNVYVIAVSMLINS